MSTTAILPGKFESGDLAAWLRQFDACSAANGWKVTEDKDDKVLKLPAFLIGQAASHFYAIPEDDRKTYATAVKGLTRAMCPAAKRENFYAEFEDRVLRPGEDPAVYKWELENILEKADPTLSGDAKKALVSRQFMRGLPGTIKIKLLEHDATPTLETMLSFAQRYQAVEGYTKPTYTTSATTHVDPMTDNPQLSQLMTMVASIAEKQKLLDVRLQKAEDLPPTVAPGAPRNGGACYSCGGQGHFARECPKGPASSRLPPRPRTANRSRMTCFTCGGQGHMSRNCANNLNY